MNKQSNTYTVIYIIVMVVIVGAGLALTTMSLRDRQVANANADKMKQILASVNIDVTGAEAEEQFKSHITEMMLVNTAGEVVETSGPDNLDIFNIDVAKEAKIDEGERRLPVFKCVLDDGKVKYILPVSGNGLWGAIWGYVSVDDNGSTVFGTYFSHASETPGLGAEIAKDDFQGRFVGKNFFVDDTFKPIKVVKTGQRPTDDSDYIDGISGGTITSKGVETMIDNCIRPYEAYLRSLK